MGLQECSIEFEIPVHLVPTAPQPQKTFMNVNRTCSWVWFVKNLDFSPPADRH